MSPHLLIATSVLCIVALAGACQGDDAIKASGRDCFDCGGDAPGNFCINLESADLTGTGEGDGLVERRCETILQEDLDDVACDGKASRFERKGEEGYPLCPAFMGAT